MRRKKGRQGRSRAVRERVAAERAEQTLKLSGAYTTTRKCTDKRCLGTEFDQIYDHCSGDTVCTRCGRVVEESGSGAPENNGLGFQLRFVSKPYDRLVHFQQRIAQLTCRDPALPSWFLRTLGEFYAENRETLELELGVPAERWGIRSWKRILEGPLLRVYMELVCPPDKAPKRTALPNGNSPSKVAIHWLQIRKALDIVPWEVDLDSATLMAMRLRYRVVSHAFDQTLRRPTPDETRLPIHDRVAPLSRKNIINVNYTMSQLLRMVNEPLWLRIARFIPQLVSQNQPQQNNQRWRILMEHCNAKFKNHAEVCEPLEWHFKPITDVELNEQFNFFQ
jgi:hypothetical protein